MRLNRAQTLHGVTDSLKEYCEQKFCKSAGMIFVGSDESLQMVSQWRSHRIQKKYLADAVIKRSPVAHTFRTGEPSSWHDHSCWPINAPGQQPVGVLVMALKDGDQFVAAMRDELQKLSHIAAECIVRARAYDAAVEARTKAEDTASRQDEFISMVAHELRNPMMPILGWAVALTSGTLSADKQNQAVEVILRNVRVLNRLIDDLFDAARISSGKLQLQRAEVRIQEVAREALTFIQHAAQVKKLRVSTDIAEGVPPFFADSRRLQQVLINLLNNAVKFTPDGGSIVLKIRRRDNSVECVVSDTGKGIEQKFLPFVFDPYRQENRCRVNAGGLGLGLRIVREIVSLHGGSIRACSSGPGKGATFILRLPLRRAQRLYSLVRKKTVPHPK